MKSVHPFPLAVAGLLTAAFSIPSATAANVILNGGFEDPPVFNPGNNFPGAVTNWTLVPDAGPAPCEMGHNIILASAGYTGGPDAAVDGNQYYDICGAAGYVWQSFTLGSPSMVTFGASFSRRDADTGGGSTDIYDAANNVLLFSSPPAIVDAGEDQEIWRVSSANIPVLPAGTYVMRVNIQDPANADAVFVDVTPIPEPGTAWLVVGALAATARRRK